MVKIGVFDSGIGGFSILHEIVKVLPDISIDYIADDAFAPYGEKKSEIIIDRCRKNTDYLIKKGVDLIVVACNTATAVGIDLLRSEYDIPFVGVEPYINIQNRDDFLKENSRLLLLTTELTGNSKRFKMLKKKLDPNNSIFLHRCKNLASIIENAYYSNKCSDLLLKSKIEAELLGVIGKKFTHVILGCTHYPLVGDIIGSILEVQTISSCSRVADRVKSILLSSGIVIQNDLKTNADLMKIKFYFESTGRGILRQMSIAKTYIIFDRP